MLIALSTLCQLLRTRAMASVPSERVASFCASASICVAIAALRSRSSLRFSSSAFFSLTLATRAGDWPVVLAPMDEKPLAGNADIVAAVTALVVMGKKKRMGVYGDLHVCSGNGT